MDIYHEKPYREKGNAKKVLDDQHKSLRKEGYESIMLSVLLTNPALHLYKKLGYEILEQTTNHAEMILSIKNIT